MLDYRHKTHKAAMTSLRKVNTNKKELMQIKVLIFILSSVNINILFLGAHMVSFSGKLQLLVRFF